MLLSYENVVAFGNQKIVKPQKYDCLNFLSGNLHKHLYFKHQTKLGIRFSMKRARYIEVFTSCSQYIEILYIYGYTFLVVTSVKSKKSGRKLSKKS